MFHLAYERRFYTRTLDALALHARNAPEEPAGRPRFQATFCIDEREESLRRHVEELAPDAVTYGIAGFYFVDMYFRGAADAHFTPLCPAVMRPGHWVVETVDADGDETFLRRSRLRRALGVACGAHALHDGYTDLIYVLLPVWQAEFGLSYAEVGLLRGAFAGAMAAFQIPAAWLSERVGAATMLAAGTALSAAAFLLVGTAAGFVTANR